ncbi:iron uptake porin [Prochlorothrix hollandica]|uniref:SLH domain-containing protein n=1 Tax=Prochlorothrix hollandica PCC 9006 = CALU 1027 TaxID=317619 RepID=A0A0M2PY06_PROHO|nr:iron uptake porin [Prochlorothrix hollandica]KKI99266.1 hypothetical protein PROH_16160 [Prochlorothrix hollandica PCC 9006 = CALU 1027]
MSKLFLKSLVMTPVLLGAALVASSVSAQELNAEETLSQLSQYTAGNDSMGQLRSVSQLSDVRPTDWAYQAVRSLVERYNCVAGYPDGTFRGGRAMTRYEAAALVNSCMDTVNDLIAAATADLVTKEDLAVLQRLQEEFQAELATLRGRVDSLEARTAELEANQFSTTTKLGGGAIFSLNDAFGNSTDTTDNTVFGGRVRLSFDTSFTGSDLLRTRLEAENIKNVSNFNTGSLEYSGSGADVDGGAGSEVSVILDSFWYQFPVGEKAEITVGPIGVAPGNFVPTTVWGGGFISDYFDTGSALYETDSDESGLGGNYQVNEYFNIAAGYSADNLSDDPNAGVFNHNYTAMTQLTGTTGKFTGALVYAHSYNNAGDVWSSKGTTLSADPFGNTPTTSDTVGVLMSYQFSPKFILQGYAGHAWMSHETTSANAKSLSAGLGFIFPDALIEGNEAGVAVGIPPYNYNSTAASNPNMPLAADIYYDWKISDNIKVTPAVLLLFNANGGSTAGDDFEAVTAIKTTFRF